ncbi:MAG: hypothetical protein K0S71_2687 [Clostridia bacterium]|nr:hypothetical protein [Clostridia bacterium]
MIEVFKILSERFEVEVVIILLSIGLIGYLFKKYVDINMMNEFDTLLIPKIENEWNKILWTIASAFIFNAFLIFYALTALTVMQSYLVHIKQISLIFFVITFISLMFSIFYRLTLKPILTWLHIYTLLTYLLKKILKLLKKDYGRLKERVSNLVYKIYKEFYFYFSFISILSLAVLYMVLISEHFSKSPSKTFNSSNIVEWFIWYGASTVVIFIILLMCKGLSKIIRDNKPSLSKYVMRKIHSKDIENKKIYLFYLLDKKNLVLGDHKSYEDSKTLYLYDKDQDSYLEFKKVDNNE